MVTNTKKIVALVALILLAGIALVELTRSETADAALVPGGAAGYAQQRVDRAFGIVAGLPPATFEVALAQKSDRLPSACAEADAECADWAYETAAGPVMIVETRNESGSTLTRFTGTYVAGY